DKPARCIDPAVSHTLPLYLRANATPAFRVFDRDIATRRISKAVAAKRSQAFYRHFDAKRDRDDEVDRVGQRQNEKIARSGAGNLSIFEQVELASSGTRTVCDMQEHILKAISVQLVSQSLDLIASRSDPVACGYHPAIDRLFQDASNERR
ncbi:hypothetical protein, partial [Pseudomonas sp. JAI120]|uniref:hypothetical protein n=1 Tax=Pseudomonas sp. JAI120 TaxID=2723063 RepID=UPI0030ED919F